MLDPYRRAMTIKLFILLLLPMVTICSDLSLPMDCNDVYNQDTSRSSGVYTIYPIGTTSAVQVYCDMDSLQGKWTVFQRRMDGSVNFYRPWNQYKFGFGNAAGEYWLGLENVFHLTKRRSELLIDMEDFDGNKSYARYTSFSVGPESDGYRLHLTGFTDGGARDSLSHISGQKFSTFDKDQDTWENNCARLFLAGFWYSDCHSANPNGVYLWGADSTLYAIGVEWISWKGRGYSLKAISMKIRPVQ
ncbi:microfibril-associated glycoprotein 4-like isoform X1 [Poeciliopsis prolifica]|uniref:microfibril-associated glycoprotein 4-like isoform X1 n=1 Tax=Poeciliopsis prolifica TaxID=188132 RepID=UPI0024138C6C|nr:microfibril-associated glycoprotein 4-like isoform X1 [Poeciliopsis prolifica]